MLFGSYLQGRWGRAILLSMPLSSFRGQGALGVHTLPGVVAPVSDGVPSLSLALGLYYELPTPALWGDMGPGFDHQAQDQDKWQGLDQGKRLPTKPILSVVSQSLAYIEMSVNTSSLHHAHTAHTCPMSIDLSM